ncbi:MAG: hypothetical protein KIT84_43315 [Labilithrix sp.]|nr:hypothetical protein [Labilithrix sp.]MCW5817908.1 hypothetical protein [Labilithrix sp.]
MRFVLVSCVLLVPGAALADEVEVEEPRPAPPAYGDPPAPITPANVRPPPEEYVHKSPPEPPPIGHSGFQMAIRSGASLPFGAAKDSFAGEETSPEHWSSSLRDLTGLQVPLIVDIGGKPNKHVFIGGFISYARGFTAGALADACDRLPLDCYSTNTRIGAQVHYVFSPNAWFTPWVGYGFGWSWMTAGDGQREARFRGLDFAHFLLGFDLRLSRMFGAGVFVDYTLGTYSRQELSADATTGKVDGPIVGRSVHSWLTIGPRLVIMP